MERGSESGGADLESCPVCEELHGVDLRYVEHVTRDPARGQAHARDIAEALGHCAPHAAYLAGCENRSASITRVFRKAIEFSLEFLEGDKLRSEEGRDVLFASAHACPACRYLERTRSGVLSRSAAGLQNREKALRQTPALCYAHYCGMIGVTDAANVPELAATELDRFPSAAVFPTSANAPDDRPSALTLVAGSAMLFETWVQQCGKALERWALEWDVPGDVRDAPEACPICVAMLRDLRRRIENAKRAVRLGLDGWTVFPNCAPHLWLFARLAGTKVAERASEHAAAMIADMLRSGIATLASERQRIEEDAKSVWHKPISPAYLLGLERRYVTNLRPCAVCEGVAVARERAVDEFLALVRKRRSRDQFERGYGMCMKHFAHAFLFAPKGAVRDAVAAVQSQRLSALHRELSESLDRLSGSASVRSDGIESPLWKEAVYRFSGRI